MPEGDTIWRTADTLHRALAGQTVTRFETVLPKLARVDEDAPLAGRTVVAARARGKWLLLEFSGGLTLLTHMLMSGSWHIYRPGERWQRGRGHMRIAIETPRMTAVAFDVPVAEFHSAASLMRRRGLNQLGPSAAADDYDPGLAAANLRSRPELEAADALLRQSLVAGLGNVFKSEVLFACGVHPFRTIGSLRREEVDALAAAARRFVLANLAGGDRRTTGRADPEARLWVYGRTGEPCRRCGAAIVSEKRGDDARISFWCPACQRDA